MGQDFLDIQYTSNSVCFSHYVTHEPQPLLENVVHVGGINIKVGTIFILSAEYITTYSIIYMQALYIQLNLM